MLTCTHCNLPLYAVNPGTGALLPGYGSSPTARITLRHLRVFVRSGSIFLRGQCEACRTVNMMRDPQGALTVVLEEYEQAKSKPAVQTVQTIHILEARRVGLVLAEVGTMPKVAKVAVAMG